MNSECGYELAKKTTFYTIKPRKYLKYESKFKKINAACGCVGNLGFELYN